MLCALRAQSDDVMKLKLYIQHGVEYDSFLQPTLIYGKEYL
ncbi:hypothetical protein CARG_03060 [Corynebacterium argentoratense DSM 44202]|uniref:Uncharacterized protein n=1 Tax=Corynebacterium argentoratense DSM 44202 TaxID=1348662 RepID=U3GTX3_9CORY|nr:hypothetical protein CARG_03060 [Corynebacterium argentoratense DSM 44202]